MNDVAIYNEKGRDFITVFTFSDEAYMAVFDACIDNEIRITAVTAGNKPGSSRLRIETTKERLNKLLEGE